MKDTLSHLTKATALVATMPAAVMMDAFTLGGTLVGKTTPFTLTQLIDLRDAMTKATSSN